MHLYQDPETHHETTVSEPSKKGLKDKPATRIIIDDLYSETGGTETTVAKSSDTTLG